MSSLEIKIVPKGWGYEKWICNTEEYCGKLLHIIKGKKCSWHYHTLKDETFYLQERKLLVRYSHKDNLDQAYNYLLKANEFAQQDRFDLAILESLRQYVYLFKEKKFLNDKKNLGKLSIISETFQRCYLEDPKTDEYFFNLINNNESDFTRYIYFYLSYLIENDRLEEAKNITQEIEFINTTLLLSQGKSWIEN